MLIVASRAILLLAGVMFLQGVPLVAYAAETCDFGGNPGNGLIIFSGTMPKDTDNPPLTGMPLAFTYLYNHAGGTFLTQQSALLTPTGLFHTSYPNDFPDVGFGRLFVLQLKAGDYEFEGWSYRGAGRGEQKALGLKPLVFSVEPHRAVYLGNLDPKIFTGTNRLGHTVAEPWLTVRDQSTRDLGVFRAKCPGFDIAQVDVKVLSPAPWMVHAKSP